MASKSEEAKLRAAQRRAYRSKDPLWWCNLGAVYATRTPPDYARARQWYAKAAAAGDPRAAYELGVMLLEGEGGERDVRAGIQLLRTAAEADDIDALKVLHEGYSTGLWGFRRSARSARACAARLKQLCNPRRPD